MRHGAPPVTHMLDIERVSWSPGGAITVLDSVTLRVAEGEFVGLVGPNGSGKTSLLRCVFRYARPDAGRVALDAQDVWRMRRARSRSASRCCSRRRRTISG